MSKASDVVVATFVTSEIIGTGPTTVNVTGEMLGGGNTVVELGFRLMAPASATVRWIIWHGSPKMPVQSFLGFPDRETRILYDSMTSSPPFKEFVILESPVVEQVVIKCHLKCADGQNVYIGVLSQDSSYDTAVTVAGEIHYCLGIHSRKGEVSLDEGNVYAPPSRPRAAKLKNIPSVGTKKKDAGKKKVLKKKDKKGKKGGKAKKSLKKIKKSTKKGKKPSKGKKMARAEMLVSRLKQAMQKEKKLKSKK